MVQFFKNNLENFKVLLIHSGHFHLDELLVAAQVVVFGGRSPKSFEIVRTRDEDLIHSFREEGDVIIADVGMEYDGVSEFDHHQNKDMPAACALFWKSLKEAFNLEAYKKVERLINEASAADTGKQMPAEFALGNLILSFNLMEEEKGFEAALKMVIQVLETIKLEDEEAIKAEQLAKEAKELFEGRALELQEFTPAWKKAINGEKTPGVEHVIWYDKQQDRHLVQVVPAAEDTFKFHGRPLKKNNTAHFVHDAKFLAVFNKRIELIQYLESLYS